MALSTTIQPKYVFRLAAITLVSLVLGLWGVYDYAVRIPRQQELFDRGQIYAQVEKALTAAQEGNTSSVATAREAVTDELEKLQAAGTLDDPAASEDEKGWANELSLFNAALVEASSGRPVTQASEGYIKTYDLAKELVSKTASVEKPGTFDRITQIAFISCLLLVPYFLWQYQRLKKTVFRLEDDGSLVHPDGTIPADQIADIDMSRWMAKSVAWVVGKDGTRIKLDDYIHKDVHRIVGKLAHDRDPEAWDDEARPVKKDAEPEAPEDGDADEADVADAAARE